MRVEQLKKVVKENEKKIDLSSRAAFVVSCIEKF